jgi:hypothetical protein
VSTIIFVTLTILECEENAQRDGRSNRALFLHCGLAGFAPGAVSFIVANRTMAGFTIISDVFDQRFCELSHWFIEVGLMFIHRYTTIRTLAFAAKLV